MRKGFKADVSKHFMFLELIPHKNERNKKDFDFHQSLFWSWRTESNPRPADYKSAALPAELHQRISQYKLFYWCLNCSLAHDTMIV